MDIMCIEGGHVVDKASVEPKSLALLKWSDIWLLRYVYGYKMSYSVSVRFQQLGSLAPVTFLVMWIAGAKKRQLNGGKCHCSHLFFVDGLYLPAHFAFGIHTWFFLLFALFL